MSSENWHISFCVRKSKWISESHDYDRLMTWIKGDNYQCSNAKSVTVYRNDLNESVLLFGESQFTYVQQRIQNNHSVGWLETMCSLWNEKQVIR